MRKFIFIIFLFMASIGYSQSFDTLLVHFNHNESNIPDNYKDSIDAFLAKQNGPNPKFLIYGLADYLGNKEQNLVLSEARAQSVAQYLVAQKINKADFLVIKGLGQDFEKNKNEAEGNSRKRNAMILVPKRTTLAGYSSPKAKLPEPKVPESLKKIIETTEVNQTFVFNDIFFGASTDYILPNSMPKLNELLEVMKAFPNLKIDIEGHICCNQLEGSDPNSAPYKLSISRAKRVYDFLIANKIEPNRLRYSGYGRTRPIFDDERIEANQAANRRVEIRVIAK